MKFFNKEVSNQKVVIATATLVVLLAGGVFAWQYFAGQGKVEDKTANWQSYRSEEIEFEALLPADWKVSEENGIMSRGITPYVLFESADYSGETISSPINQVVHSGTRVIINRYENPMNFTPAQLVADYAVQQNREIIEVGGAQGVIVDTVAEFGIYETVVVLVSENFVYQIGRTYPEGLKTQYEEVFDQILSTFKFIADQELSIEEVKNAEYTSPLNPSYAKEMIRLTDGVYDSRIAGAGNFELISIYNDKIALGDLNGDGKGDAAVVITGNGGGSGSFRNLSVLLNQNGKPQELDSIGLGDRVIINSIEVMSGEIVLDMVVHGEGENFKGQCCPNVPTTKKFKLAEDKLVETP